MQGADFQDNRYPPPLREGALSGAEGAGEGEKHPACYETEEKKDKN
jgi:hypothetical protein